MKLQVPPYIKIEPRQLAKAKEWFDRRNDRIVASLKLRASAVAFVEEDCCCGSSLSWHVRDSGICCEIYIEDVITKERCDLTIDDDNELSPLL